MFSDEVCWWSSVTVMLADRYVDILICWCSSVYACTTCLSNRELRIDRACDDSSFSVRPSVVDCARSFDRVLAYGLLYQSQVHIFFMYMLA